MRVGAHMFIYLQIPLYTLMLTLTHLEHNSERNVYTARIQGPKGTLELRDLTWIVDRKDLLEDYYWSAWAVFQGVYHCCWSIPGKVLLIEHEPGC